MLGVNLYNFEMFSTVYTTNCTPSTKNIKKSVYRRDKGPFLFN